MDPDGSSENARKTGGEDAKIPLREKAKWRAKRRVAEIRGKVVQPRRERFFSEAHPKAYAVISTVGPRLHTLAIALIIGYYIFRELLRGNFGFVMQWYRSSPLPAIIEILTTKELLQAYAPVIALLILICVILLVMIYMLPWRLLFKDYKRVIVNNWNDRLEIAPVPEGRLYWRTDNALYQLWDAWYQSPERKTVRIYLHRRWWPPLNILNPPASLISVELSKEERLEQRGLFEVYGHEKPYRWRSGLNQYKTRDAPYSTTESPLEDTQDLFDQGVRRIVGEMRDLTNANSAIRLKQLASQTYGVEEEFLRMIEEDERKEAERRGGEASARP